MASNGSPFSGADFGSASIIAPGFTSDSAGVSRPPSGYFAIQSTVSCPARRKSSTYWCHSAADFSGEAAVLFVINDVLPTFYSPEIPIPLGYALREEYRGVRGLRRQRWD